MRGSPNLTAKNLTRGFFGKKKKEWGWGGWCKLGFFFYKNWGFIWYTPVCLS